MEISFEEIGGKVVPGSAFYERLEGPNHFALYAGIFDSHDYPNQIVEFKLLVTPGESVVSFFVHLTNLYSIAKSREDFTDKIQKASQKKRKRKH